MRLSLYGADYVIFDPSRRDPDGNPRPLIRDVEWSFDPIPASTEGSRSGAYVIERSGGETPRLQFEPPSLGKIVDTPRGKRLVTPENPSGWDAYSVAYLATRAANNRGFVRGSAAAVIVDPSPPPARVLSDEPIRGTSQQLGFDLQDET